MKEVLGRKKQIRQLYFGDYLYITSQKSKSFSMQIRSQSHRTSGTFILLWHLGHLVRAFREVNSFTLLLTQKKHRGLKSKISPLCL